MNDPDSVSQDVSRDVNTLAAAAKTVPMRENDTAKDDFATALETSGKYVSTCSASFSTTA